MKTLRFSTAATSAAIAWLILILAISDNAQAQGCPPVSQRTGEVGCWTMVDEKLGQLFRPTVFWMLDTYPTRAAAEAAKRQRGTVVEALGKVWLLTIAEAGWRPSGGVRVAEIGPLHVRSGEEYTARYMEAIFTPGMTSSIHRHAGPEAFYTVSGETCLETSEGKVVGRPEANIVIPAGLPMLLTATGTVQRRSLVLILHESSHPSGHPAPDWMPKGLCKN